MAACNQMQGSPDDVFGGRKVYFTKEPDIRVVYCLVRRRRRRLKIPWRVDSG